MAAAHEEGRQVHGIARGWKQATSLREAGIDQKDIAAIAPFLKRAESGRIKLDANSRNEDIWRNVGDNLGRESTKATALDLLRRGTELRRGTTAALPAALERAEQRERDGHGRTTFRQKLDLHRAGRQVREMAQRVRERVHEYVRAAIPTQAERDAARDRATTIGSRSDAARREQTISRGQGLSL